ncbi:MAG TPA: bifunctional 3'-5' exonuclease/DNA polymerase, partial [Ilumatobacteraceae bacterium]|nr:bifunctional 3'-5' exonuclease/DNA polymerase [Ilumatobacteraceae bacterium]
TANGWAWLDTWVVNGRFHPDYVPGGVVTGRWATRGGGALQLPKSLRQAVVAEPGWKLVVADAAQLEPRLLAAMSGDAAMAAACRGVDLYQGFVDRGVVATRQQAKIGMLAAMYGGTSGEAGQLLQRMRRAFPTALAFVDDAATRGERFERVTTWLGRTSPTPGGRWVEAQDRAYADDAEDHVRRRAQSQAREWGRFTRNFVVQGTAAEWALCWMASLRRRLRPMRSDGAGPQLVYFLHDELIVHCPEALAEDVEVALGNAANEARRLLFGDSPVDIPLSVDIVDNYAEAG